MKYQNINGFAMNTGSCLCGKVLFQMEGTLAPIQICHCSQCRRAQGSAFACNIPVPESDVKFVQGNELLKSYESSPGKQRFFCSNCGSPIYSKTAKNPGVIRLRAGTLDEENLKLNCHIYFESKAKWFPVDDTLVKYSTLMED